VMDCKRCNCFTVGEEFCPDCKEYLKGFNDAKEQAAEEAWRTCKSRSRSLSESRMVTASNEASKCARVCKGNILKLQPEAKR
jgi:hypothetical protein